MAFGKRRCHVFFHAVLPGGVAYAASGYGLAGVSVLINGVLVALLVYTCRRNKGTILDITYYGLLFGCVNVLYHMTGW